MEDHCIKPSEFIELIRMNALDPHKWCTAAGVLEATELARQLEKKYTREQAFLVRDFWKEKYNDSVYRYEALVLPYNGLNDADRMRILSTPRMRFQIELARADVSLMSNSYMVAHAIFEQFSGD